MEMRQLKTFKVLADTLSFTKTAEKLFMAQSSVSAQIKALEDDLGVKLFDRIGRSVLLTDTGNKLYDYARRIEEMTDEIRSEVTDNSYVRGNLTIRVPDTIASFYIPCITEQFSKAHPKVKLTFINCSDRQLKEELNTGRIDLAFLMTDAVHFKDVNVKLLKKLNLVIASGPSHPLASLRKISIADLSQQRVLLSKTD